MNDCKLDKKVLEYSAMVLNKPYQKMYQAKVINYLSKILGNRQSIREMQLDSYLFTVKG